MSTSRRPLPAHALPKWADIVLLPLVNILLAFIVVGLAMLRQTLRRRLPRLFVILLAVLIVALGIHAGYVA